MPATLKRTKLVKYYTVSMTEFKKLLGIDENENIKEILCDYYTVGSEEPTFIQIKTESRT